VPSVVARASRSDARQRAAHRLIDARLIDGGGAVDRVCDSAWK
jgi:hypothetical protein